MDLSALSKRSAIEIKSNEIKDLEDSLNQIIAMLYDMPECQQYVNEENYAYQNEDEYDKKASVDDILNVMNKTTDSGLVKV